MDTEVVGTLIWKIYLARGGERSGCKTSSTDDAAGSDQARKQVAKRAAVIAEVVATTAWEQPKNQPTEQLKGRRREQRTKFRQSLQR